MSSYKRDQRNERQNFESKPNKEPCHRCNKIGHYPEKCWAIDQKCKACNKIGHYAVACNSNERKSSGYANAVRAHVETLSPNELAVFNAGQIEKAEHCGRVYNVEANDVENPETMNRHHKFAMFGHLN